MKRGLITWDREELPPAVFDGRLAHARAELARRDLPALVVYSDVTRSNQARHLTNFMPYWNRSLAVIPRDQPPVLLCALSPRVYPWIRSVTVFEEIRPAGKLVQSLGQLCTERGWKKFGVLDQAMLPYDLHEQLKKIGVEILDVPGTVLADDGEIAMRRRGAELARRILDGAIDSGHGLSDYEFCGRLEREFRRAGAEDLIILIGAGGAPAPAKGVKLGDEYSVRVALEYRGHWVKVTRARTTATLRDRFEQALQQGSGQVEDLSGPYPAMSCERSALGPGSIFALHVEDRGVFYGDTCVGTAVL